MAVGTLRRSPSIDCDAVDAGRVHKIVSDTVDLTPVGKIGCVNADAVALVVDGEVFN